MMGKSVPRITILHHMACHVKTLEQNTASSSLDGCVMTGLVNMSRDMRFPTMWYVQPAKPQISLPIRQSDQRLC